VAVAIKEKLAAQFLSLDPVQLLQEIRLALQSLRDIAARGPALDAAALAHPDIAEFLAIDPEGCRIEALINAPA
jgi:hypothetical protein